MQFHHQSSVSGAESTGDQCWAQGSCPQDTLRLSLLFPAAVREGIQGVCHALRWGWQLAPGRKPLIPLLRSFYS